ncbi:hypothetical protein SapgrDRAFT_1561 [Saprospira grandis DSM 2844]|uniref:Uncharacterized protein n=1 Tax=Saprospira grandis DSM 2844 TaxID=694433 RepID=J0P6Z4_9BACT|nr:hypothetical protein [Saprospira grandis]EJF53272.1 hypothetical protein SapgrDRAFT_1561 [Saprospira grandis DSM 2844]
MRLLFFLLFSFSLHAQTSSYFLFDEESQTPIPYTSLSLKDHSQHWSTDSLGQLTIAAEFQQDSLFVRSLNYPNAAIILAQLHTDTIWLSPQAHQLEGITVKAKKAKKKRIRPQGKTVKIKAYFFNKFSSDNTRYLRQRNARYFENREQKTGYLAEIAFDVINKRGWENAFRLWIYSHQDSVPGQAISPPIDFIPEQKNAWQKCDLQDYRIEVPKDGFWVVVEAVKDSAHLEAPSYSAKDTTITDLERWRVRTDQNGHVISYSRRHRTGLRTELLKSPYCSSYAFQSYTTKAPQQPLAWQTSCIYHDTKEYKISCIKMKAWVYWD